MTPEIHILAGGTRHEAQCMIRDRALQRRRLGGLILVHNMRLDYDMNSFWTGVHNVLFVRVEDFYPSLEWECDVRVFDVNHPFKLAGTGRAIIGRVEAVGRKHDDYPATWLTSEPSDFEWDSELTTDVERILQS